jgi:thiamine biosynthesis lipoprotein
MERRAFLQPHRWMTFAEQAAVPSPQDRKGLPAASLLYFRRRAMATNFEVVLPFGFPQAAAAAAGALDEVDRLEAQLSLFRPDSEVSRLNRLGAYGPLQVEEGLFALLELAAHLHRETEGAYDISTGALSRVWGFLRRQGRVPQPAELAAARACCGMHQVVLDRQHRRVHFLRPGVEINLGSIGKGYALDRAAALLRSHWGCRSALLHGGRSSIYALGSAPDCPRGWPVGVAHPWDRRRRLAVLYLRDAGLGTSAATFQHLEHNGRRLGHILDPRSGWPAEGLASVTVLAPTAAEADALATAFFVLGLEKSCAYCATHPHIRALLLPAQPGASLVAVGLTPADVDYCDGGP